jgi:prepilin-type N-terminal cleavage/methylation domain-containing protein/prepilin-type processing-associated H-X9-DG protein
MTDSTKASCARPKRCCPLRRLFGDRAFTLIELLVSVAVIALLMSLVLPAMGRTLLLAKQTRETVAARQLMIAFTCYAGDNKSAVLMGYPTNAMVDGPMIVLDDKGRRLFDEQAQRYPWRIVPYYGSDFSALYSNQKLLSDLRDAEAQYASMGISYPYVISLFPSLGMNVAFIGGADNYGEFDPLFTRTFGQQYISRLEDPVHPSRLLAFVSARCEQQATLPGLGPLDGFFRVAPPYFSAAAGRQWATTYDPNAASPGANSGYTALRYAGKGVCAMFDGHVEMLGFGDLLDMTRWSDKATGPTWGIGQK